MELKDTPLTRWHQEHGAHLAEFGGYRMPLWYKSGPVQEHRRVITRAGLFDTSHMAELLIEGPDAQELLQQALTKDLSTCLGGHPLEPGRATYGFLLNENGHLIDDAIVMMEERERFLLVVNAGMGDPVARHLHTLGEELDATVSDLTGRLGKIDLQGPAALAILKKALKPNRKLDAGFPYFGFIGHYDQLQRGVASTLGFPVLVSRTGYTGEFGFELFVRPCDLLRFWEQLLDVGQTHDLIPCGLGARDSLRTGAGLPLSHQDLGDWPATNHPWRFALPWKGNRFSKSFHGSEALLAATPAADHTHTFLGETGRKVDPGARVLHNGEEIGTVLTCATDMAIDRIDGQILSIASPGIPEDFSPKGLACGFVKLNQALPHGTALILRDKRRELPVTLVSNIRPHRTARLPWPAE